MDFAKVALVGSGGFLGAGLRYVVDGWIHQRLGAGFPWGTFLINISGSFVLGLFMGLALAENLNPNWRLFFGMGMVGGYTTYSTFAYETVRMLEEQSYRDAAWYFLGTGFLAIAAAFAGIVAARLLTRGSA